LSLEDIVGRTCRGRAKGERDKNRERERERERERKENQKSVVFSANKNPTSK